MSAPPPPSWQPPARDPYVELGDEGRTAEAVRERLVERELRQRASESATFAGTLRDLAEAATAVTLRVATGRSYQGALVAVAIDHVVLRSDAGASVHVAVDQVTAVQPGPGYPPAVATGERESAAGRTLDEVLFDALEERPTVALVTQGDGASHRGRLLAVGEDVLTLQATDAGMLRYVPTHSVSEVVIG